MASGEAPAAAFEPIHLPQRPINESHDRRSGRDEVVRSVRLGGVMRAKTALWLDCDFSSLTVLVIGVCVVSLLAVGGF
jgi:hypothetical protein